MNEATLRALEAYAKAHPDQISDDSPLKSSLNQPSEPPAAAPAPARHSSTDWSQIDLRKLSIDGVEQLFASAQAGDASAAAMFSKFLDEGGSAVWRQAGNLAAVAEKALMNAMFDGSVPLCISGRRKFQEMRAELTSSNASPLEKLANERVLLTAMYAFAIDAFVAMQGPAGITSPELGRAQQLAERRMTAAMKSVKIAREISRAPSAGPLVLFSRPPGEAQVPPTASIA